jgi:dehydrogenase/reductase SDR family protein 7B
VSQHYFREKVVWITGATSGIGEETARQLDRMGAKLVLSARNLNRLEEVRNSLLRKDKHMILPLDLEHSEHFDDFAKEVVDRMGSIDMLVNNGGISQRSTVQDTSNEVDRKILEVNYFGNIALTKAVLPFMVQQRSGQIVIISSIAGKFGFFLRSAYSASKHALHGYYESLRLEQEENNISVTLVCPGKIKTNISLHALSGDGTTHGSMDRNQETGMDVGICVEKMLKAVSKKKYEVLIGNNEIWAVYIKRLFPKLFWKIIKGQPAK